GPVPDAPPFQGHDRRRGGLSHVNGRPPGTPQTPGPTPQLRSGVPAPRTSLATVSHGAPPARPSEVLACAPPARRTAREADRGERARDLPVRPVPRRR